MAEVGTRDQEQDVNESWFRCRCGGGVVTPLLFVAISATQGVLPRASGAQTAEFIETFCIGEDGLTSPIITPPPRVDQPNVDL